MSILTWFFFCCVIFVYRAGKNHDLKFQVKSSQIQHIFENTQVKSNQVNHVSGTMQVKSNQVNHIAGTTQVKSNQVNPQNTSAQVKSNQIKKSIDLTWNFKSSQVTWLEISSQFQVIFKNSCNNNFKLIYFSPRWYRLSIIKEFQLLIIIKNMTNTRAHAGGKMCSNFCCPNFPKWLEIPSQIKSSQVKIAFLWNQVKSSQIKSRKKQVGRKSSQVKSSQNPERVKSSQIKSLQNPWRVKSSHCKIHGASSQVMPKSSQVKSWLDFFSPV